MNFKKIFKDENGSFMVEAILSFMLFIIIFMAVFEVLLLVEKKLYVEKLSREIGYEAAITSTDEANEVKGLFAHQYFIEEEIPYLFIEDLNRYSSDDHIHCYVAYTPVNDIIGLESDLIDNGGWRRYSLFSCGNCSTPYDTWYTFKDRDILLIPKIP